MILVMQTALERFISRLENIFFDYFHGWLKWLIFIEVSAINFE